MEGEDREISYASLLQDLNRNLASVAISPVFSQKVKDFFDPTKYATIRDLAVRFQADSPKIFEQMAFDIEKYKHAHPSAYDPYLEDAELTYHFLMNTYQIEGSVEIPPPPPNTFLGKVWSKIKNGLSYAYHHPFKVGFWLLLGEVALFLLKQYDFPGANSAWYLQERGFDYASNLVKGTAGLHTHPSMYTTGTVDPHLQGVMEQVNMTPAPGYFTKPLPSWSSKGEVVSKLSELEDKLGDMGKNAAKYKDAKQAWRYEKLANVTRKTSELPGVGKKGRASGTRDIQRAIENLDEDYRINVPSAPVTADAYPPLARGLVGSTIAYDRTLDRNGDFYPIMDTSRAPISTPVGYVYYDSPNDDVVICFAGTNPADLADWAADSKMAVHYTIDSVEGHHLNVPIVTTWGTAQRFLNVFPSLMFNLHTVLINVHDDHLPFTKEILVTGHSLGGSVATLTGCVLQQLYPDFKFTVVGVDPPLTIAKQTQKAMLKKPLLGAFWDRSITYVSDKDLVTKLGGQASWKSFAHFGHTVQNAQEPTTGVVAMTHPLDRVVDRYEKAIDDSQYRLMHKAGSGNFTSRTRAGKQHTLRKKMSSAEAKARMAYVRSFRRK